MATTLREDTARDSVSLTSRNLNNTNSNLETGIRKAELSKFETRASALYQMRQVRSIDKTAIVVNNQQAASHKKEKAGLTGFIEPQKAFEH